MKAFIRILGIIAIAVVIGFSMTACDNGGGGDDFPLKGTKWVSGSDYYEFTSNSNFICYIWPNSLTYNCRYTLSGNTITFKFTIYDVINEVYDDAVFSGTLLEDTLTVSDSPLNVYDGIFTKQ